ncbi:Cro/CI family transcriptional regulator [Streptococcus phage Javan149]|nr:Cro/CI family transcriptional regulator [Streptococcus phage Javan149]QBX23738.1 Cro/CI family transcriptional regulator [Streptococcus phage Javan146]
MSAVFDRVRELCQTKKMSLNALEDELNLGKNSLYGLKKGNPNSKVLEKIADYFNVSIDYLLDRTAFKYIPKTENNTIEIKELVDSAMFFDGKPISEEEKITIQGIIEGYLNNRK